MDELAVIDKTIMQRLGLHPWRMIAERYGRDRPSKLKRIIVSVQDDERYRWLRGVAGLERGERRGTETTDCFGKTVLLNERIVDHIRPKPERAPYLTWVPQALTTPLEVWRSHREGERGLEPRLYYLFAAIRPTLHSIVVIVSEPDSVAFNVIPLDPREVKSFRTGELAFVGYDAPYGRCPHGCCDRTELA